MKKVLFYCFAILIIMNFTTCSNENSKAPRISVQDFFKNPQRTNVQLSPNGKYISYFQPWNKRLNIYVLEIKTGNINRLTAIKDRDIAAYRWANSSRIVYLKDLSGSGIYNLYGVNVTGDSHKKLTDFTNTRVWILDVLKKSNDEILISLNKRDKRIFDVHKINIYSGKTEVVAQNPGNIAYWKTDNDENIRLAVAKSEGNDIILFKPKVGNKFIEILRTKSGESFEPICFDYENKNIYAASNIGRDKKAIVEFDPVSKKQIRVIYQNQEVDVQSLYGSATRKVLTHVIYYKEKMNYHILDEEYGKLMQKLKNRFPEQEIIIASQSSDENKLLIKVYSDVNPGQYFYYNRLTNEFIKLLDEAPWIDSNQMAKTEAITFRSRDGLKINGYLTTPKGYKKENLPLVVNPHGGPWTRDKWLFNKEVQFLANRGYLVFQLNYRGSSGYGQSFLEAGFKEWGKKIQNDVTDGVKHLIKKGYADSLNVAIFGSSFGGYVALAGLAYTPQLYCCGISNCGISNILNFLENLPDFWQIHKNDIYKMVGNPNKDREMLKQYSPIFSINTIQVPVFIAQGAKDPLIKKEDGYKMRDLLLSKNIPVEFMEKDNEGHGYKNQENKIAFYKELEKFLKKNVNHKKYSNKN